MRVEIPGNRRDIDHAASEPGSAGKRTFSGAVGSWPLPECAALRWHCARKGVPAWAKQAPLRRGFPFVENRTNVLANILIY